MYRKVLLLVTTLLIAVPAIMGFQASDQISRQQLKDMLVQLGYDVKDLDATAGKEKYSFTVERSGLNIPVAAEISANGNYIWLTVFCKEGAPSGDKALNLLKRNAEIQPTQFYVSKSGKIMAGLTIENREVNNAILRQRTEKIAEDVAKTKEDWQ